MDPVGTVEDDLRAAAGRRIAASDGTPASRAVVFTSRETDAGVLHVSAG